MPLRGQRILVVEDESAVAFDVGCIIRKARGTVSAYAVSLDQAIKLADEPEFSLAVLDFRLGRDTSLPVAEKLDAAGIPFVFHTGCGISELEKAYPQAPIVEKPATAEDLVASLVYLLSTPMHRPALSKAVL
jgi:DNA-binding NtrC family response regulator